MRGYIFTEKERRLLEAWLKTGEENQTTKDIFCMIRRNVSPLNRDLRLMLKVIRELKKERRWSGRVTESSEFGSTFRLVESALTRLKSGRIT